MTTVGAYEAKTHLPALLDRAARGESITITKRGKPVAMLVPPKAVERQDAIEAAEELIAYRKSRNLRLNGLKIRDLIDEGRKY